MAKAVALGSVLKSPISHHAWSGVQKCTPCEPRVGREVSIGPGHWVATSVPGTSCLSASLDA
eukprot:3721392-Pyramimonas_sp.AAC.1